MTTRSFTPSSASADRRAAMIAEVQAFAASLRALPPGAPRPFILFPATPRRAIRNEAELRQFDQDDLGEDGEQLGLDWTLLDVPGSSAPLFLPDPTSWEWDQVVEWMVTADAASESSGPWVSERREELCRSGDIYLVHRDRDDHSVEVVGQFDDHHAGLAALVAASSSFVLTDADVPVSIWLDEEAAAWELDELTDDEDDECIVTSDDTWQRLRDRL